MEATIYI